MEPSVSAGATVLVDRFHYSESPISRWDIVVIAVNYEQISFLPKRSVVDVPDFGRGPKRLEMIPNFCFVTRVVGIANQSIVLNSHSLTRDGAEETIPSHLTSAYAALEPLNIDTGVGEVFVMNDNISNSVDSRHFGAIPSEYVIGKVVGIPTL